MWWKKTELRESTSMDTREEKQEWYNMDNGYTLDMGLNAEWEMDGDDNDEQCKNWGEDTMVGDDNKEGKDNKEIEMERNEGIDSGGVTAGNVDKSSDGDDGRGKKTQDVKERGSK